LKLLGTRHPTELWACRLANLRSQRREGKEDQQVRLNDRVFRKRPPTLNSQLSARLLAMLTRKFVEQSQDNGQDNDQDNIISLEVAVPAAPGGGSGKLVFENQNAKTPDAVVVKAIARASIWFEQLTTGKSQSIAEIAACENITDNYVSNLIHLAWLSPDLVDRVLEGDPEATALARAAMLTRKSDALWKQR
jgi:hypothetical protein